MSHFPDDVKPDKVKEFRSTECIECGRKAVLDGRDKLDYWLEWAFEEGHIGDMSYVWIRFSREWYCTECANEYHEEMYDNLG